MLTLAQQRNRAKNSHLASPARPDRAHSQLVATENPLIAQQQSLGNQAMQRLLNSRVIQTKLTLNEPGDKYEQEADRVAEQVMRMPDPGATNEAPISGQTQSIQIQRMCSECEEESHRQPMEEEGPVLGEIQTLGIQRVCSECEEELHRQPLEGHPLDEEEEPIASGMPAGMSGEAPQLVKNHLTNLGGGHHLPESIRAFFEPRFGNDFSQVHVHTDSSAAESARAINARAFTVGRDVVFGAGLYTPETVEGKKLLAHELAHVVQQQKGGVGSLQPHLAVGSTRDFYETEADRVAERVMSGDRQVASTLTPVKPSVQRACGPAIGPAVGCTPAVDEPVGDLVLFRVNCDEFASVAEQTRVEDFADSMAVGDRVRVHGFASTDGTAAFNENLSCARAQSAAGVLQSKGIPAGQMDILQHGPTPGPARERRSVVLEPVPGVSRPVVPQLSPVVTTAPTPGDCGGMNFVVQWNLSRNSAANGGFVIQHVHETWDVRDCTGATVANPDPRTSPLDFFEAWRVLPLSTNMTPVNTDTFFWPSSLPWAGGCTSGTVAITATAQYHDNVAALPAHMIVNNPATFAGGLQSSLTDPSLGGNVSRPVPHSLSFHWDCCPCSSSPTVVDGHTP